MLILPQQILALCIKVALGNGAHFFDERDIFQQHQSCGDSTCTGEKTSFQARSNNCQFLLQYLNNVIKIKEIKGQNCSLNS